MSVASSDPSNHSTPLPWRLNNRLASLMDSIYAIGAGLGLRLVVDTVTRHDFKITGTLVGLWEGVILLHFMKKMPRSSDPFVAFAVRLFIDFIITESISRFVLVVIWAGMGMVLADITPAVWEDFGMRRTWRHFRRDLYTISEMIPTVAFYPPTRTVRFSPSRELSVIEPLDADADAQVEPPSDVSSSVDMTEHPTLTDIVPPISNSDELIRRRVPGYFPGAFSDTDSVPSSVVGHRRLPSTLQRDQTRTVHRRSAYPSGDFDFNSDVDEANVSSNNSSTPTPTISLHADISAITEIPDEEEPPMSSTQMAEPEETAAVKDEVPATPKQLFPPIFPPTPSDSQAPYKHRFLDEDSIRQRESIPQMSEDMTTDGGEKVRKEDAERAPTPPEKDWPKRTTTYKPKITFTNVAPTALGGEDWGTTDSPQASERPIDNSTSQTDETTNINETHERRLSQPPAYSDDIYEPEDAETTLPVVNPLASLAERDEEWKRREAVEAERVLREEDRQREEARKEAEERRLKEAEEQKNRDEVEEEEKRKEGKKKADKEERVRKEAVDAANREKKRAEDEAERLRKLAEATKAEEAAQKKKEAAVQKKEEEAAQRKKDEEVAQKKKDEESAQKQKDEKAVQKQKDEEAAQKQKDEEAAQKKKDEEAAQKKKDEEAAQKKKDEEAAQKQKDEEAVQKQKDEEEAAQKKREDEEAAQKKIDEEAAQMTEDEHQGVQANLAAQTITSPFALEREEQHAQETEKEVVRGADEEVLQEEEHQTAQADAPAQTTAYSSAGLGENDGDCQRKPTLSNIPDSESGSTFSRQNPDVGLHGEEEQTADQRMETDTVTSELSEQGEVPNTVGDRLERVLLLKAQIVEVQKNIEEFEEQMKGADEEGKAQIKRALHPIQKALRKMKKREQRCWEADVVLKIEPSAANTESGNFLDNVAVGDLTKRVQEKLESLLSPNAKSLYLFIECPQGSKKQKPKPKDNVTEVLTQFRLLDYTKEDKNNARLCTIDVPESRFAEWLTSYRIYATTEDDDDFLIQ